MTYTTFYIISFWAGNFWENKYEYFLDLKKFLPNTVPHDYIQTHANDCGLQNRRTRKDVHILCVNT